MNVLWYIPSIAACAVGIVATSYGLATDNMTVYAVGYYLLLAPGVISGWAVWEKRGLRKENARKEK
jgi:hypothetical protein